MGFGGFDEVVEELGLDNIGPGASSDPSEEVVNTTTDPNTEEFKEEEIIDLNVTK